MSLNPFENRLWRLAAILSLACSLSTGLAAADPGDEPQIPPARELWSLGQRYFREGDFTRAADSFDRAYEIERVPSLGVWVARSLANAGRLVEAEARYRDLVEASLPPDAPQKDWLAKQKAEAERRLLAQRIASVTVVLEGVATEVARVSVNGQVVPREFVGEPRRVNPGLVRVRGQALGRTVDAEVTLAEGESRRLLLSFIPEPPPPPPPAGPRFAGEGASAPEPRTPAKPGETQRVLSYVAVGLGGAALLTGGAFGILALDDQARLQRDCPNDRCPAGLSQDVDSYDSKRTVASVALLAGAAFAATGVVLFLTAPRASSDSGLRPALYVAGTSFGLTGRFE